MEKLLRNSAAIAVSLLVAIITTLFGIEITKKENPQVVPYEISATQDIKYKVNSSPLKELKEAMTFIEGVMGGPTQRGAGYRIRLSTSPLWSYILPYTKIMSRLKSRLEYASVGDTWLIQSIKTDYTMKTLKLDLNPAKILDTPGTQAIDIVVGTLVAKFGNEVRLLGICVCRHIAGSSSWSQHAYCNAVDLGGDSETLNEEAHYIYDLKNKGYVPVSQILWQGKNLIGGGSVSDHYDHVHISGAPLMGGTPACAS